MEIRVVVWHIIHTDGQTSACSSQSLALKKSVQGLTPIIHVQYINKGFIFGMHNFCERLLADIHWLARTTWFVHATCCTIASNFLLHNIRVYWCGRLQWARYRLLSSVQLYLPAWLQEAVLVLLAKSDTLLTVMQTFVYIVRFILTS
jgi:hypothetical protein